MTILEVKNVSIRYMTGDFKDIGLKEYVMRKLKGDYHVQEFWADRDITFSLEQGDMLGIIGTNGAGKSTLLKAISGIMEPTTGCVKRQGNIAALLELASGFDGDLTVRENTYLRGAMLGYTRKFMDETYNSIIDFAELRDFQGRPFKQLSSGMKSRLAFSIASLVQPDILILDEVLSVGDGAFRKKSEAKMREIIMSGATTILVSHSIPQVKKLCNKVLWLDRGRQVAFGDAQILCSLYQQYLDKNLTLEQAENAWLALNRRYNYLVVGAGLYGAVFAHEATRRGKSCLVIDRRPYIGGNLYCEEIEGIIVHKFGPHIFHTNQKELWDYANQYTKFLLYTEGGYTDKYIGVPAKGYDPLIRELLKGSSIVTGLSYQKLIEVFPDIAERTIYTGPIDEFFEYSLGRLEYHGLRFEEKVLDQPDFQGQAIKDYPDEDPPCRIIEHKHFIGANSPKTVITREYAEEWIPGRGLCHPVEDERNRALYRQYLELAREEYPSFIFGGRLGEHRDYKMDEAIAAALDQAKELIATPEAALDK